MNYSNAGFRFFYHRFTVFDKKIIADHKDEYKEFEKADGVITYGYIDHEKGFTFDATGLVKKENENIILIEKQPKNIRTIIRAEAISKEEAVFINDDEQFVETFKEQIENINSTYENNKELEDTREMSFLDDLRDLYCIDDVQVYLFKEELDPELAWIRIKGHGEHYFIGNLLNEPEQNFGYHQGEEVIFALKKTQDETWMAICDLNPTKKLKRSDLEGGVLLKQAISAFNKDKNEANLLELMELLRDSNVIIPCKAILSKDDQENVEKLVEEAGDDHDSLVGKTITNKDQIRLVPDVLESEGNFFFPVFSSSEEMGEYGNSFSHVEAPFISVVELARISDKRLYGIVVNAFSEHFVVDEGLMDAVTKLKSRIIEE